MRRNKYIHIKSTEEEVWLYKKSTQKDGFLSVAGWFRWLAFSRMKRKQPQLRGGHSAPSESKRENEALQGVRDVDSGHKRQV